MACPICNRKTDPKLRPFCSKRCADVDLAKWLTGSYAIPSDNPDDYDALAEELDEAGRKPH
ncbi:DNA gyrase inhibitor YacG [Yoonia sp. 208BN28-4]|uniref:DNA gyrase inhibitor YacG n=1 Tax=Yoonia sp. 208BN28-4 TaxID=3126505 RepID=UPI00309818CA